MTPQFVDAFNKEKYREGDDDKTDDRVNKESIIDGDGTRRFSGSKGGIGPSDFALPENKKEVGKINIP